MVIPETCKLNVKTRRDEHVFARAVCGTTRRGTVSLVKRNTDITNHRPLGIQLLIDITHGLQLFENNTPLQGNGLFLNVFSQYPDIEVAFNGSQGLQHAYRDARCILGMDTTVCCGTCETEL